MTILINGCGNYPDDYLQFKKLPEDQQKVQFRQLPVDKQIDYYLYDQNHEPPRMGFDEELARQGRSVLPTLLRRLREEPADYRRCDLIWAIEVMHQKFVPLQDDKEVIATIETAIDEMTDGHWARMSRKSLKVIKAKPGTPFGMPTPPDPRRHLLNL